MTHPWPLLRLASGRLIPLIAGGSGDDTPPPDPADDTPPDPPGKDNPAPPPEPKGVDDLPDWAQKEIRTARKEAADRRGELRTLKDEQAKTAETLAAIGKALGLDADKPPDPEQLQAQIAERDGQLEARDAAIRQQAVELAALRAAPKLGANPDALLDSRSFVATLESLDPAADDFAASLDEAITKALEANPTLQATPGGRRGPKQGPQGDPSHRAGSLMGAVNARLQTR